MYTKIMFRRAGFGLLLLLFLQGLPAQSSGKFIKQVEQDSFTLYFALPVSMKAEEARVKFEPDFTYHDYEGAPGRDQVTMNFSLFTKEDPVKQIERIEFQAGQESFTTKNVSFLYLEKNGRKWHTRFSALVPVSAYRAVLEKAESTVFEIHAEKRTFIVPGNRKWRKSAGIVAEYLTNQ